MEIPNFLMVAGQIINPARIESIYKHDYQSENGSMVNEPYRVALRLASGETIVLGYADQATRDQKFNLLARGVGVSP